MEGRGDRTGTGRPNCERRRRRKEEGDFVPTPRWLAKISEKKIVVDVIKIGNQMGEKTKNKKKKKKEKRKMNGGKDDEGEKKERERKKERKKES